MPTRGIDRSWRDARVWMRVALAMLLSWPFPSFSADKSGVTPNTISLPSGPGSIEGLGEAFQPSLNTGTAKYGVGLQLPPGIAGHAPSLSLRYEGGGGNGPVGFGWNLPLPFIQRQCDKGIPRYVDGDNQIDDDRDGELDEHDERDVFINEMKEELVPQSSGFYFCENEGAFIRYRRSGEHWEGTLPNGVRLEFGLTSSGRVHDGTTNRVFRWLLERSTDTHGNTIVYSYRSFAGDADRNQKHLATIRYGPGAPPWANFHFAAFGYEGRPDWFEDCRSGFAVRTGRRLKEVVIGSQGPVLAGHLAGDFDGDGQADHLVRKYQLDYLRYAGTNSHWSLLASILQVGADGTSSLPPARFDYAVCNPPELLSAGGREIGGVNEPPFVMDNELTDLVDLNGDGLPDILKTESGGGAHTGYRNLGETLNGGERAIQWSAPTEIASADGLAWNVDLQSASSVAHLADMDGDGVADLAYKSAIGDIYYFANDAKLSWGRRQEMSVQDFAPPSPFGDPDVRTADLDFDKRIDIIQSISVGNGADYRIWFNLGAQRYSRSLTVPQETGFLLSQPGVHVVDFNGDRVPDIVRVRVATVTVTAGLGHGHFADPVVVSIPDPELEDTQVTSVKLQDITGDGLADLVLERAEPGQLWYWLNLGNYTFSPRKIISGMPGALGFQPAIRWADMNGNGTTDLVYADSQSVPRLRTVDIGQLLGCVPEPNTLVRIENGIGRVTHIQYEPSTKFALEDAAKGEPWQDVMPFPISVISQVRTEDSLGNAYVTNLRYHDGYYDAEEKDFRGFARAERIDVGDETAPSLVSRTFFNTGRHHEALKGKVERVVREQEDGRIFDDECTEWASPPRVLMTGINGQEVRFTHPVHVTQQILELGSGEPRFLESEFAYDDYGNTVLDANYGIVVGADRTAFDDERIVRTDYAINTNAWLVRFTSRVEIMDENGEVISRTENFYDDESFSGANLGRVMLGNSTMTREWSDPGDPGAYINSSRTKYDGYGNPTMLLDPLAVVSGGETDLTAGHVRQIVYDDRFRAYPLREIIHVGKGADPLTVEVDYDEGFGVIIRSSDLNANVTTYGFDAFGRIVNMVNPGDTEAFPTAEYDYVLAKPFGAGGLINYVESRLLDKDPSTPGEKRDHYYISRQFSDGLGRPLMLKHEAEKDPETSMPRAVVKDAVTFNARMATSQAMNPFLSTTIGDDLDAILAFEDVREPGWHGVFHEEGEMLSLDFVSAHKTLTEYDATMRSLKVTHPDGTFGQTSYAPLMTINHDENDSDENSPFFETPTIYHVDGLGRQIRTDEIVRLNDDGTSAGGLNRWTTLAEYDLNDQLIRLTDSQNNVMILTHDGLQRMTRVKDPNRGQIDNVYDAASNTIETTDAKNQRITYTYDGVNRLLTEDYHDGGELFSFGHEFDVSQPLSSTNRPDVAYFYDVPKPDLDQGNGDSATARNTKGMRAFVWDLTGEEHTSYDERGRVEWTVKRVRDPLHGQLVPYRTGSTYDATDRLTRIVYPDNDEVSYEYNDRNLFERITGGPTGFIVSDFNHLPGEIKGSIRYGNGIQTTYGYDRRLRLNSLRTIRNSEPGGSPETELINFDYELDAVSNLTAIQDRRAVSGISEGDSRRNTQFFVYDDLYRLRSVQYSFSNPGNPLRDDGRIHYRYDRIGNMLAKTSTLVHEENGKALTDLGLMICGGGEGAWGRIGGATTAPGPHAVSEIRSPGGDIRNYAYDASGNVTNLDGLICVWDFKDRLVVTENEEMRVEYSYDHTNRRITKKATPKDAKTDYQPQSTIYIGKHFEIRDHDQPTKYVWVGGTRIAQVTGSLSSNQRVQRLRVFPGWNLVSLAVGSSNTSVQLRHVAPPRASAVEQIFRWDQANLTYGEVQAAEGLPAGSVLWIKATRADTLTLKGTYSEPSGVSLTDGGAFHPGNGLEASPLSTLLASSLSAWTFDAAAQRWQARLGGELAQGYDFPDVIEPGQAMFIDLSTPELFPSPDPNLRIRFYHQDHLGSSGNISDSQGVSIEESAFYPFGARRIVRRTTDSSEEYRFNQKETDRETGLQYFEARYLVGSLGRFASCDPISSTAAKNRLGNPQIFHVYSYSGNNPLTRKDPSGLDPLEWAKDVGSGAFGYVSDKVSGAVDAVVENPLETAGMAVVTVITAPVIGGATAVVGVGTLAYGAAESGIKAISGDDFDSDGGYRELSPKERRQMAGRSIAGAAETVVAVTGMKKMDVPKKNYSPGTYAKTHNNAPAAHAKTHANSPKSHGSPKANAPGQPAPGKLTAEQLLQIDRQTKKLNWIAAELELANEARKGLQFVNENQQAQQIRFILQKADQLYGKD